MILISMTKLFNITNRMNILRLCSVCLLFVVTTVSSAKADETYVSGWPNLHIHQAQKQPSAEQPKYKETPISNNTAPYYPQPSATVTDEKKLKADSNKNDLEWGFLKTNSTYSKDMFDRQDNVTNKAVRLLKARQNKTVDDKSLYIGGRMTATHMEEWTDTAGKFPIISRLPNQHTSDKYGSEDAINDASINTTATFADLTLFAQGEYTEVEYPGQEETQLRKYYAMWGNLDKFPVYALVGKKTVAFGNFDSYAPFTHNHSSHYFWAQTDDPLLEVGYVDNNMEVIASLLPNSRGLRVLSAPDESGYENFALSYRQDFDVAQNTRLQVGGGFLRGTIYNSAIAHHPPTNGGNDRGWNSVWNIHSTLSGKKWDIMGEYTQTTDSWPATDHKVSALTAQGRYKDTIWQKPTTYSLMFSQGVQGESDTPWEQMLQVVAGVEIQPLPFLELGVEYLYNDGFVPLILPRITGDQGVQSHTVILGAQVTF